MKATPVLRLGARLAPSVLDQLTYGLSTFVVTAAALRSSAAEDFGRFSLIWSFAWTGVALLAELLVTPARLELTGQDADADRRAEVVERALRLAGVLLLPGSFAAAYLTLTVEVLLSVTCIALSGAAFLMRRSMMYAELRPWAAARLSLLNLSATSVLLAGVTIAGGDVLSYGRVVAAAALLFPLLALPARAHPPRDATQATMEGLVAAIHHYSHSGRWFAVATAVRTLAYTAGLLSLVSATRGFTATATLAATFVLAAPAQVLAAALPLTLFPRLVAARRASARHLTVEVARQFRGYAAISCLSATAMILGFGSWSGLMGERAAATTSVIAVTLLVVGLLMTSFSGSVILILASPRVNLLLTSVTAVVTLVLAVTLVPVDYIASVPYGVLLLCHSAIIVVKIRGRTSEEVHA